jgi:hypothetical protein
MAARSGRADYVGVFASVGGRFGQPLSLILNLAGHLRERLGVLAAVVRAKQ